MWLLASARRVLGLAIALCDNIFALRHTDETIRGRILPKGISLMTSTPPFAPPKTTGLARLFAVFSLVLASLAFTSAAIPARAHDNHIPQRLMTMSGIGKVSAAPDKAIISAAVVTQGPTAADALKRNTTAMTRVIETLIDADIKREDIQTANFSIQPQYFRDPKQRAAPEIVGYQVSNALTVTIRDIKAMGGILDRMTKTGSNRMNNIRFAITDTKPLEDRARRAAVEDAIGKAKLYAKAADIELGKIRTITEARITYPRPQAYARTFSATRAASPPVPVEPGQLEITARVNITWTLD